MQVLVLTVLDAKTLQEARYIFAYHTGFGGTAAVGKNVVLREVLFDFFPEEGHLGRGQRDVPGLGRTFFGCHPALGLRVLVYRIVR